MRAVLIYVLVCIVACRACEAREYVSVRTLPSVPDAAIEYIANVSQPRQVTILPGELPEHFIKEMCGSYTNTFANIFFAMNPTLVRQTMKFPRSVKVPACPKWKNSNDGNGIPVVVTPRDNVDGIVSRKIGRTANQVFKCAPSDSQSPRCGQTFRALVQKLNGGVDLANLKPGAAINLPFVTYRATFRLRDGDTSGDSVVARIKELTNAADPDSALISAQVAPRVWMLSPVVLDEPDRREVACTSARRTAQDANRPWPYDAQKVAAVIRRNVAAATALGQPLDPVTVTIMDSGLDASFPSGRLRRDLTVASKYNYGFGVQRPDAVSPFPDHMPPELRQHGTEVAKIAAGIPALQSAYPDLGSLFRLNVVNLMESKGTPVEYGITTGGLANAIEWFVGHGDIANVSIGSSSKLGTFLNSVLRYPKTLVVAAAGNESQPLGEEGLYPANYGGNNNEGGNQFITVAAHDGNLARATFSNVSSSYVDLFAPGCEITYDATQPGVTGTSFAAPLVTMTTALLKAFGLRSPLEIKRRLHASVDYDESLSNLALWSGRLNVIKALSLYDDVIERRSIRDLAFGRWSVSGDLCDDRAFDPDTIKKVNVLIKNGEASLRVLWSDTEGQLQVHLCKPSGDTLPIDVDPPIPWTDVVEFLPRWFDHTGKEVE